MRSVREVSKVEVISFFLGPPTTLLWSFSLSTTVSLLLLAAMAYTRYQVATTSKHSAFRLATKYPVVATLLPWMIGVLFTLLYFVDIVEVKR